MSETTPRLALPLIAAGQAQKHVTHNEALAELDALVHLACLDKDRASPPPSPAEGDRYLVLASAPTGAWAGLSGQVVRFQDGVWIGAVPRAGWLAWIADEGLLYVHSGSAWIALGSTIAALQNLARLGLGTTADAGNPFAAKLNKALWTALTTGEGGSGDLRYTLNKQAAGNVLSLLFQSGFSGRAELGLTGDDDLSLKVSADGGTFTEALRIDRVTGNVDATAAEASIAAAATVNLGALAATRVAVTGTGTVSSFGSVAKRVRILRFTGAVTLTHNPPSLSLPTGANILTEAGDAALTASDPAGNWRVLIFARASGKPLAGIGTQDASAVTITGGAINNTPIGAATPSTVNATNYLLGGVPAVSSSAEFRFLNYSSGKQALAYADLYGSQAYYTANLIVFRTDAMATILRLENGLATLSGVLKPSADNTYSLCMATNRATVVYAATGTINTSDAREKTPVRPLTDQELAAAKALAREVGVFGWLAAIEQKGDAARLHIGMTVQRAMEIMGAHGLDAVRYGLVCHDTWDAIPPTPAIEARAPEYDADGVMIDPGEFGRPADPGRAAGDRFGFRVDQLLLFLARGFDARLGALEARTP
jgi:hypothetical protein